jgi:signal transduction histidine kinase
MDIPDEPQPPTVDSVLAAWRRDAAHAVLRMSVCIHLPAMVLLLLGYGPPVGRMVRGSGLAIYAVFLACCFIRRVNIHLRLAVFFTAGYAAMVLVNIAAPRGPFAQVGVVVLPLIALVVSGVAAARAAVGVSLAILAATPLLRRVPAVARGMSILPDSSGNSATLPWVQAIVVAAFLCGLTVMLVRMQRFLLCTVKAEREAAGELLREARRRRRLEREVAGIAGQERRRLGQEMHDGVCQLLTAALMRCRMMERLDTPSKAGIGALGALLSEVIDEAHNVAEGLCPLGADPCALVPALQLLTSRTEETAGVRCDFSTAGDVSIADRDTAQHLFRITQEALNNAARHAHAGRIWVELRGGPGHLLLQVDDNGMGLPAQPPPGRMGLRTMASRAGILEGDLSVGSRPGGGVRVTCRVPRRSSTAEVANES